MLTSSALSLALEQVSVDGWVSGYIAFYGTVECIVRLSIKRRISSYRQVWQEATHRVLVQFGLEKRLTLRYGSDSSKKKAFSLTVENGALPGIDWSILKKINK